MILRPALTLLAATLALLPLAPPRAAAQPADLEQRITELAPALEAYVAKNMQEFDLPGMAIGIVAGDRLVYAKGFGVREKGGAPVDPTTIFQIGSTTKAFLATTLAIAADRRTLAWNDRIVDLYPEFQMRDAWVTREFRVFDLLAQRSGLPAYANDALGILGYDEATLIRSLRYIEPASSFRSSFAYTNITHMLAGRIVAAREGVPDWNALLKRDLLDPLGMRATTTSAAAIEAAPNHAEGYLYDPAGSTKVPFTQTFPYDFAGAGDINSSIEDMQHWLRLQLNDGTIDGKRIVSAGSLAYVRMPKVSITDRVTYALGWVIAGTPNGTVVWHNGGTTAFGAYVGLQLDRKLGIVVLSNQTNVGLPDAIGAWAMDRLMGNPDVDHAAAALANARAKAADAAKQFAKPAEPQPFPNLALLAGTYNNPAFGRAEIRSDAGGLVMRLVVTGAEFRLEPWDGAVMTATLVPDGRFAAIAANNGPLPMAFIDPQIDRQGRLAVLRLVFDDGQTLGFARQ
jgi:CubicO group peptidase (beta-lactamase class C family)